MLDNNNGLRIQLDIYILLCMAQQHIGQLAALLAMQ
jgi:hypothetical protein